MEAQDPSAGQSSGKLAKMEDIFNSDFVRLQEIFPKEIWTVVTKKLDMENPNATENLANSSPFFQNLLASQRTTYLFEKVFHLVASTVWKKEGLEGLPVSEVLKCRAVCSKWNAAVDKLVPEKFQYFAPNSLDDHSKCVREAFESIIKNDKLFDDPMKSRIYTLLFDLPTQKTVRDFLRHFELTHPGNQRNGRNPLIWGDLSVELSRSQGFQNEADYQFHLEDISKVLNKYGNHIHNFSFDFNRDQVYSLVSIWQPWFSNMPNLKELHLCGTDALTEIDLERNLNYDAISPFPKFKHLEQLTTIGIQDQMFNQLILENDQVSDLSILGTEGPNSYDFLALPLPNLKELEMEYNSDEIIAQLRSSEVQWPLEMLSLRFTNGVSPTARCGAAAVFQIIQEKFAKTLSTFYFETEIMDSAVDGPVYQDCKNFRLDLPNLKEMSLFISGSLVCLDFLLPMKNSLEEIAVSYGYESDVIQNYKEKVKRETIVEFVGFEMNILDSNIWKIFEKLKEIRLTRMKMTNGDFEHGTPSTYSREDWMKKQLTI